MVFAYIPLFLILTAGLVALFIWQYIAFGTYSDPHLNNKTDLYFSSSMSIPLQILNVIEFIWGLQFLRDACKHLLYYSQLRGFWKLCRMVLQERSPYQRYSLLQALHKTSLQELGKRCRGIFPECFLQPVRYDLRLLQSKPMSNVFSASLTEAVQSAVPATILSAAVTISSNWFELMPTPTST